MKAARHYRMESYGSMHGIAWNRMWRWYISEIRFSACQILEITDNGRN